MERKYQYGTAENKAFLAELRTGLIAFGRNFPSPGGSSWHLGNDGTPRKEKDRMTYVTCRMAHVYSIGAMLGYPECEPLVDEALRALNGELYDAEHGGWYPGLHADGTPLPDKLCYAHAFVILAASSAMLIGRPGAKELFDLATATYDRYFWNEDEGLSADYWNTAFTECAAYRGLNANMHTVEAFLAAADVTGEEKYRVRAGRIIAHVLGWARENDWRLPEHYAADWTPLYDFNSEKKDDPFKPYGATPGHGLEWSRLIAQWALSAYPGEPEKAAPYLEAAERLFERALEDAWDCDGAPGIVYTTDWDGSPCVHDRMHWVLMEAIDTAAVLYRLTEKERFAGWYAKLMGYMDACVVDHAEGSFFHQLDRENRPIATVWDGKDDLYHAFQMTLIPYLDTPELSVAPAVLRATRK
ncbi:MAG: AGE family epimerase/isomerase [Clostridia bacterium]|nr:AGE family epimerase/isomerase [Clostridia bacterium]